MLIEYYGDLKKRREHPIISFNRELRIRISMLMPFQIRIRIGIKTMPIHMWILLPLLHKLEIREKIYFYSQQCPYTMFLLYHQWQMSHPILDSILKFYEKKS
jgi:hypothetical protein